MYCATGHVSESGSHVKSQIRRADSARASYLGADFGFLFPQPSRETQSQIGLVRLLVGNLRPKASGRVVQYHQRKTLSTRMRHSSFIAARSGM